MEEKRVRTAWRRYRQFRAAAFVAAAVGAFLALAVSLWAAQRALADQAGLPVGFYVVAAALVVLVIFLFVRPMGALGHRSQVRRA